MYSGYILIVGNSRKPVFRREYGTGDTARETLAEDVNRYLRDPSGHPSMRIWCKIPGGRRFLYRSFAENSIGNDFH